MCERQCLVKGRRKFYLKKEKNDSESLWNLEFQLLANIYIL